MDERERVLDAIDETIDRLEDDDDVAYAEVGGVYREKSDAVVTEDGVRDAQSFPETGLWMRVFANGAADYRYTSTLTEEAIEDVIGRVVRGGKYLAQDQPDRVDTMSLHRGVHVGWASEAVNDLPLEEKLDRLRDSFERATADLDVERVRLNYEDTHLDQSVVTTTGSSIRTVTDRAQVRTVLQPADAPKIQRHHGSTRGLGFFDELDDHFEDVAASARRLQSAESAHRTGEFDVVLSPRAAGQVVAFLARYLEQDVVYQGLSPYEVGQDVAPEGLTVEDTVHAGSWGATAYDAECRPTHPVTLVRDGTVENFLHNTATAAEEGVFPSGNAVQSIGLDAPPRIHARHLDVEDGDASADELRADAAVYVERFDEPWHRQEFERVQRTGQMPPSVMYAKKVDEKTVDLEDVGRAAFPVAEGYLLEDGARGARLSGVALEYTPDTLRGIDAVGSARATLTGVDEKHKSHLPYAVTAPAIRLRASLVEHGE
jgi:TldD protein